MTMVVEPVREQAVAVYRESLAGDQPVNGRKLGEMFGRSDSWGRSVIRDARKPTETTVTAAEDERKPADDRAVRWTTVVAVVTVAIVAAVVSYSHMQQLAEQAGEGWRSYLLPLAVDGLVVAASMTMLIRRRRGRKAGALAWCSLLVGIGASLAANVAAAEPTLVGRLVAAWPPVALLLAYEMLMRQVRNQR